jgi:hypothetical protein
MQAVLDLVWEHLLPALDAAALDADPAALTALSDRLQTLSVPVPAGGRYSPRATHRSGRTFSFKDNPEQIQSATFAFGADACSVTIRDARGDKHLECGYESWREGTAVFDDQGPQPVGVSGAWASEDTFVLSVIYRETPFCETYECRFVDDGMTMDWRVNVSFGPTDIAHLEGKAIQGDPS